MRHIPLILFVLFKLAMFAIYTYLIVYLYYYSLAPLIELHGGWNFIGTILGTTFIGFISAFLFFWMPAPKRPQATRKEILR